MNDPLLTDRMELEIMKVAGTTDRALRGWARRLLLAAALLLPSGIGQAETFTINTPGGAVTIEISHVGPSGSLVTPGDPDSPSFRPPSIFSAPLPAGSGARALGFAGSFTAIADDATAASWNPAGLIQLERPEASFVLRYAAHDSRHFSDNVDFQVGDNTFDNFNLNYLSVVYPLLIGDKNLVFSMNYQEAYDFEQRFTASVLGDSTRTASKSTSQLYADSQVDSITSGDVEITVTSALNTTLNSYLTQLLMSDMLTGVDFQQEGVIDAITPAFAYEITPKVCAGFALNFYQDNSMGGHPVRSKTTARYSGSSGSSVSIEDLRTTSGTYAYSGVWHVPDIEIMPGIIVPGADVPISGSGEYSPFSDSSSSRRSDTVVFDGVYTERNEFDNVSGFNTTLGLLVFVSRRMNVGLTVDFPWTARAAQTKIVENTITTYDSGHTVALDESTASTVERKNVEFRFPTYIAAGVVWRWNNVLSSCLDASQTRWSEFRYQAGDDDPINPLDGSSYGLHPIDDCWAVRYGMEYLWVLNKTEIPFRFGLTWEQRPAIGAPDEFVGYSVGTGISLGMEPGKLILDVAYNHMQGSDVLRSLVPDQSGLSTDAEEQQLFVSGIWHF